MLFRIGQVAKHCNISTATLRFYERSGLISAACRSQSGYRLYTQQSIWQLKFILKAKHLGFSLKEIQKLITMKIMADDHSCREIKQFVNGKEQQIANQITSLQNFQLLLQRLSSNCCGSYHNAKNCSILETLADRQAIADSN